MRNYVKRIIFVLLAFGLCASAFAQRVPRDTADGQNVTVMEFGAGVSDENMLQGSFILINESGKKISKMYMNFSIIAENLATGEESSFGTFYKVESREVDDKGQYFHCDVKECEPGEYDGYYFSIGSFHIKRIEYSDGSAWEDRW